WSLAMATILLWLVALVWMAWHNRFDWWAAYSQGAGSNLGPSRLYHFLRAHYSLPGASAVALLAVLALAGFTYLQLVGHLFAGFSGRWWLVSATLFFYLIVLPDGIAIIGLLEQEFAPTFARFVEV